MKKWTAAILAGGLALSMMVPGGFAAEQSFADVSPDHWAYEAIQGMAGGGLLSGYGDGKFGPEDTITVSQMATIVGNAKGTTAYAGADGYWAYGNIEYCLNTLKCLPDYGDITAENYDIPCTRELAIYMLVEGLGIKQTGDTIVAKTADAIPDYPLITLTYKKAVLKAYQYGILTGKDESHTFGPQDTLTRCEMATIFYRAGWEEAGMKVATGDAPSIDEIVAALKAMPDVTWSEKQDRTGSVTTLTANERKYGGLYIEYGAKTLGIYMPEQVNSIAMNSSGQYIDVNGQVVEWNERYKLCPYPTTFSYENRQFVKKILAIIYPTQYEEAYTALKEVMLGEAYETSSNNPVALRWYDGRYFKAGLSDHSTCIITREPGDAEAYNKAKAEAVSSIHYTPTYYATNDAYELDKW
jgi:hypothetical protein